jgi:hypothetical protein
MTGTGHRLLAAGLCALALLVPQSSQAAGFPTAFVVADVPVDATAQTPQQARESARLDGQRRALRQLFERLTAKSEWPQLPPVTDQMASSLLQDFEVANEHSSAVRYYANYTYRFNPAGVRRLLHDDHLAFTELASKPVVIVPVLKNGDSVHLWDDPNPWRAAWSAGAGKSGLVPWTVPVGDIGDVSALDAPDAQKPTPEQIQALSQRHDGGDPVVVVAEPSEGNGQATLAITVTRYSPDGTPTSSSTQVSAGRLDEVLYAAGVQAAARELEDGWKSMTLGGGDQVALVTVTVPITGAADWAAVRDRLAKVPAVEARQVELMTRNSVRLRMKLKGDANLLRVAFAQQDLVYAPGPQGATIQLRNPIAKIADAPATGAAPVKTDE